MCTVVASSSSSPGKSFAGGGGEGGKEGKKTTVWTLFLLSPAASSPSTVDCKLWAEGRGEGRKLQTRRTCTKKGRVRKLASSRARPLRWRAKEKFLGSLLLSALTALGLKVATDSKILAWWREKSSLTFAFLPAPPLRPLNGFFEI